MSGFGSAMRKRFAKLREAGEDVKAIMAEVNQGATIAAVTAATQATPPNGGAPLKGVNTRTRVLADAWGNDSITAPAWVGNGCETHLKNRTNYATYVNDGHRMDRHFTVHVALEGGQITGKPDGDGGLMVGTKTTYVPGLYMKEKGIGKWKTVVRFELDKRVRERFSK